jgi:hypothetical protein
LLRSQNIIEAGAFADLVRDDDPFVPFHVPVDPKAGRAKLNGSLTWLGPTPSGTSSTSST